MGSNQTEQSFVFFEMGPLPQVSGFTLLRDVGNEIVESSSFSCRDSKPAEIYSGARPEACVATHFQAPSRRMKVSVNLKR